MPNYKDQEVEKVLPGQGDSSDPKVQEILKKAKGYETVLKKLIHGEKTRDEVITMIKSNPDPYIVAPQVAVTVNDMGLNTMKQGGVEVERSVQMVASQFLIDDILLLGQGAAGWEVTDELTQAVVEDTYQVYVERGLKDKSIDPIQLQLEAQEVMSEEQLAAGLVMGEAKGTPQQPSEEVMTEQYADKKTHTALQGQREKGLAREAKGKQQALSQGQAQQIAQNQQQQQQQHPQRGIQ